MKKLVMVLIMLLIGAGFMACTQEEGQEPTEAPTQKVMGELTYEVIPASQIENEAVKAWYEENKGVEGIYQKTEENEGTYILISGGEQPTGGYTVEILSVVGTEDKIEVAAQLNEAKEVTQVITYPSKLIKISQDERDIKLQMAEKEVKHNTEGLKTTGIFVGLIDSNSIEVKIEGKAMAFMLSEDVKDRIQSIKEGEKIEFEYYEKELDGDYKQMVITKIL